MTQHNEMTEDELIWDAYNCLLLSNDVSRVQKLLVRYELFKSCLSVPGDIVECGVFKGVGFIYWLKLLMLYSPRSSKIVIGFDTFDSFGAPLLEYERGSADKFLREASFSGNNYKCLQNKLVQFGFSDRAELIKGDIAKTAADYIKNNTGFRISLLHLDLDSYHGTKGALQAFYDLVVPGGIIIFDEYGKRGWGESDAVDEFFKGRGVSLSAVPHAHQPTAFIKKESW